MKNILFASPMLILLFMATLCANVTPTFAATSHTPNSAVTPLNLANYKQVQVCNQAAKGSAHCLAIVLKPQGIVPNAARSNTPQGLTPANLQAAYKLPSTTAGVGQTVAIVDANDDPKAESDLAIYRSTFGQKEQEVSIYMFFH